MSYFYVAVGGFLGAISRYYLSTYFNRKSQGMLPFGTLFVNIVGSFLLGLLFGIAGGTNNYLLFGTGFMGAFTTFSTFMVEVLTINEGKLLGKGFFYILLSVVIGLFFAFIGYSISDG
ncbi:fluoride efflux transporter CrcB [Caldibacillus lycopersici]|uniref:Fluoride-specific ion channel FluC n=1 Tax=Perspicuibacillus lycopersici TaxID=1325689 RepID=A0AAE3IVD7_9BACI|nr:fluoride efflux transporter CrcB [Perspicuibacillus lycopersici]MCU9613589.1 fluoride efflux transporter CrcB [Perspicuibacillus lycopersici]